MGADLTTTVTPSDLQSRKLPLWERGLRAVWVLGLLGGALTLLSMAVLQDVGSVFARLLLTWVWLVFAGLAAERLAKRVDRAQRRAWELRQRLTGRLLAMSLMPFYLARFAASEPQSPWLASAEIDVAVFTVLYVGCCGFLGFALWREARHWREAGAARDEPAPARR